MLSTLVHATLQSTLAALPDGLLLAAARTSTRLPLLARPEEPPIRRMIWPAALILVFAAILLGALSIVRRRMRQHDQPNLMRGFTLDDLRQLKREGKLTDEEFDKAKAKIVANVQRSLAKPAPTKDAMGVEPKE